MLQAVSVLLSMAMTLLSSVNGVNISPELRLQATQVANYAISYAQQVLTQEQTVVVTNPITTPVFGSADPVVQPTIPSVAVPQPEPAPVVPQLALVGAPLFTLRGGLVEDNIIDSLDFTTTVPVACTFDNTKSGNKAGVSLTFETHCVASTVSQVRPLLIDCNAEYDKGLYLLTPGKTYTCGILLRTADGKEDRTNTFSFSVPN